MGCKRFNGGSYLCVGIIHVVWGVDGGGGSFGWIEVGKPETELSSSVPIDASLLLHNQSADKHCYLK